MCPQTCTNISQCGTKSVWFLRHYFEIRSSTQAFGSSAHVLFINHSQRHVCNQIRRNSSKELRHSLCCPVLLSIYYSLIKISLKHSSIFSPNQYILREVVFERYILPQLLGLLLSVVIYPDTLMLFPFTDKLMVNQRGLQ